MNNPTFQEQYNKIVDAYYKDELVPYANCACFVGNLLNNDDNWALGRGNKFGTTNRRWESITEAEQCIKKNANGFYTLQEILALEMIFMDTLHKNLTNDAPSPLRKKWEGWENSLFDAMSTTLDALKLIHASKGEVIESFSFQKRKLVCKE
jgi:hypothetical protein